MINKEVKEREWCIGVIDIETTDTKIHKGKIVEVGLVSLNTVTGERDLIFQTICHERPITEFEVTNSWIVNNSSLTVNAIRHSPQLKSFQEELQNHINSLEFGVTSFNKSFDIKFLEDRGFDFIYDTECIMLAAMEFCKIPNTNKKYAEKQPYKWPKATEAYEKIVGLYDYVHTHRAGDDAMLEAEILQNLLQKSNYFSL